MMNMLVSLGLGIIVFSLIVATGLVVMANMGTAVASCPAGYSYNTNGSATSTLNQCFNVTGAGMDGTNVTDASQGTQSLTTITGYVQSNLVTWIPAVIALGVGLMFIGALMSKRSNRY